MVFASESEARFRLAGSKTAAISKSVRPESGLMDPTFLRRLRSFRLACDGFAGRWGVLLLTRRDGRTKAQRCPSRDRSGTVWVSRNSGQSFKPDKRGDREYTSRVGAKAVVDKHKMPLAQEGSAPVRFEDHEWQREKYDGRNVASGHGPLYMRRGKASRNLWLFKMERHATGRRAVTTMVTGQSPEVAEASFHRIQTVNM